MKNNHRYNKNKGKNIKTARTMILFIIIVAFVVVGSTLMAIKFSESKQAVQALDVNKETNSESNLDSNKEKSLDSNGENNTDNKGNVNSLENDPVADDIAFVEKYLNQQMKGQMPDGAADGKKVVYLTFDDGPSETVTPHILDTLKAENVHATFFLVGKAIDESKVTKDLVKREVEEGNAIGNHTYSHNYNYLYPNKTVNVDNVMADVNKTNQSLKNIFGENFSTRAIRFPGGHMTWKGMDSMDALMKEKDYHQVDWNAMTRDAEGKPKNAEQLKQELIKTIVGRQKAVILMHDTYGKEETAKALPGIIQYLREQGYEFRTMK
ncbi:xylanase deacetylase [Clostridium gelidum]|uniref:Xylanase deacetylase n=1 Tax=Clostridium gelidum TaxID=704125 RepID=A0ABM7T0D3_9CLOT|nr:polysaccharide deacetylase family protein [Clostridium gelidum]BCZ44362.1 xylanase deacetylase [Clostridium gelidum]